MMNSQAKFPYNFHDITSINRRDKKNSTIQFHHILNHNCFDIAFEIEWKAMTPLALNPCIDSLEVENIEGFSKKEYSGYNRRWLMIDDRLVISPFTVKSAIANGFANLMGGCYRVNTRIEGQKSIEKGQYPYRGGYKRYRVARDSFKPGIIKAIKKLNNGDREIFIQPVEEFYLDRPDSSLVQGKKYFVKVKVRDRNRKPGIIEYISKKPEKNTIEVTYYGPYTSGMCSQTGTKHHHRFYRENGKQLKGVIPAINFYDKETLKKYVSLGGTDQKGNQVEWYQDLTTLSVGSFVYFQEFNGVVTNIGKNFLFKALFFHEDAVPEPYRACTDPTMLCPRCRLFGMTAKTKDDAPLGFKGRFKASALVNDKVLIKKEIYSEIPITNKEESNFIKVKTLEYYYNQELICKQYLLPILAEPKPNKRDVDGYYNKTTGMIEGAKYYLHGSLDLNSLENKIKNLNNEKKYTHKLRSFAIVCREGESFSGTLGAENCTIEEIAALMVLLHTPFALYGFKIGLGKSIGMGSISSTIKRVWIRGKDYLWQSFELYEFLEEYPLIHKEIEQLSEPSKIVNKLEMQNNSIAVPKINLKYPPKGEDYWKSLKKHENTETHSP